MAIAFYLDNRPDRYGDNMIRVSWCFRGTRIMTTIGYGITPEKISEQKERFCVKRGSINFRGIPYNYINSRIDSIYNDVRDFEIEMSRTPEVRPSKSELREVLAQSIGRHMKDKQNSTIFPALLRFVREESELKHWADNTIKKFGTMQHHLEDFNPKLRFSQIDESLLNTYLKFLSEEKGLLDETLKKETKLLKWFLKWASKHGYHHNLSIEDFTPKTKSSKNPVVFLEAEEVVKLRDFEIPEDGTVVSLCNVFGQEYSKTSTGKASMEKTRDLFLFCCYTSLRYSDLKNLKSTDIYGGALHIVTVKTDDPLTIQINPYAQGILDKYHGDAMDGAALPVISEQKMNEYLKDLGELCGLNSPLTFVQYRGGKRVDAVFPKWQKLTTHCGRRTFICLAIAAGIPPSVIMKFTGHSDYNTMRPYIDVSEKTKIEAMKIYSEQFSDII